MSVCSLFSAVGWGFETGVSSVGGEKLLQSPHGEVG